MPDVGCRMPPARSNNVDLPEPFGPRIAHDSPARTLSETGPRMRFDPIETVASTMRTTSGGFRLGFHGAPQYAERVSGRRRASRRLRIRSFHRSVH